MKIDYFFAVFKEDNAKNFFTKFFKSNFYKNHSGINSETKKKNKDNSKDSKVDANKEVNESRVYFVCCADDKENLEYLSKEALLHPEYKVLVTNKSFNYNDAFAIALKHFKGDVVLLGDMKIAKLDLVFEKCLQKKEKCNVVHVVKKQTGFKGFFKRMFIKGYNFFIKLFTGKKDRYNVVSLGLIDKHIIQLLQVLPSKNCFLKNTKDLKGFETRTIYIDSNTKTYKRSYKTMTGSLKTVVWSCVIFFVLLLATILLNIFLSVVPAINIILVLLMFASIILSTMFLPKHVFDIRNKESKEFNFEVKEIN